VSQDLQLARRAGAAPKINLLPSWVAERRLVRRQRLGAAAGFVLVLVVLALVWVAETARAERAQRAAEGQRATTARLAAQRAQLQPWADLQTEVAAAEQLRASVYAREVRFSGVMQDISMLIPDNAWLTTMSANLTETQPGQAGAGGTQASGGAKSGGAETVLVPGAPGYGSPVGSINFSGAALGHVDVGRMIKTLDGAVKRNGGSVYLNPYFTSSQKQSQGGQTTVTFVATVDLGPAAFSGRFQRPGQTGGR
jgi:type II secretory pathway pseudopilin PulG